MKKAVYVFILGVLLTFIGAGAGADTIDKLSLAGNIVTITGIYYDAWAVECNPMAAMRDGEIGRI